MLLCSTVTTKGNRLPVPMISAARDKRRGDLGSLMEARLVKLSMIFVALSVTLASCGGASTGGQDTVGSPGAATTEAQHSTSDGPTGQMSPDPAFDPILPTLRRMTTAPIMLPTSLPEKIKSVGIEEKASEADPYATEGDKYSILLLYEDTAPDQPIKPYVHYMTAGRVVAWPASAPAPDPTNGSGTAKRLEDVALPDGTVANLKRLEPPPGANYGPFTVGTFEEEGERYTVMIEGDTPEGAMTRQILSTMVRVPGT